MTLEATSKIYSQYLAADYLFKLFVLFYRDRLWIGESLTGVKRHFFFHH